MNKETLPVKQDEYIDLDTFKSIYYWANAKPDTQIKFFRKRKIVEVSDIHDLNSRIDQKLKNHPIMTYMVKLTFILTEGNVKEYGSWDEFQREDWGTINQQVESINLTWDLTFSMPDFALPQRHTLKVRIGNAMPPKDMLQIMFTSDEPTELMESQAEGLVKLDFINQVVANELIQIVDHWQKGLKELLNPKSLILFLEKRESYIRSFIVYFVPITFLALSYFCHQLLYNYFNYSKELNIISMQRLMLIYITLLGLGLFIAKYFSNWFGNKVHKFKHENGIAISKGDQNYLQEIKKENETVLGQILNKVIISVVGTIILITIKFFFLKMIE